MSTEYVVIVESFADRHFIKNFEKKYKGAWSVTWKAIEEELKRFDSLLATSITETIVDGKSIKICKTEFRIARTRESRKSSGNRCIIAVHKDTSTVHILLVYHKNDLGTSNETARWKELIKRSYPEYRELL